MKLHMFGPLLGRPLMGMCVLAGVAATSFGAVAQQNDPRAQIDQAFRAVLANPADLDVGYRYAQVLISAGNYEGGISALERMLLDPNAAPAIRVELAVLYFRLGSYAAAASYAQDAMEDPRLDPQLKTIAGSLYNQAFERTKVNQLTGSVMFALRGQSNGTAATDSSTIFGGGVLVARPADQGPKSAFDAVLTGRLEHVWDFGTQNTMALVSTLTGYANKYSNAASYDTVGGKLEPQDLIAVEATSGIRFEPDSVGMPGLSFRPHLILGDAVLSGHQYFATYGAGIDASLRFGEGTWLLEGTYEARGLSYADRNDVNLATDQDGIDHVLRGRLTHEFMPGHVLVGELNGRRRLTDQDFFDFTSGEARLTYVRSYTNPFGWDNQLWSSSFYAAPMVRKYDGADPAVHPGTVRKDVELRVGMVSTVPLTESLSVLVQAEYLRSDSNLRNFDYDNALGMVGLLWRY